MHYDYLYAKHQRRITPPFHKSKRGLDDWMRSFRSIDQHPYDLLEIQSLKEQVALNKKSIQETDSMQHIIDKILLQEYRNDEKSAKIMLEKSHRYIDNQSNEIDG